MSKRLDETIATVEHDGLIVSNEPVADVIGVTLAAAGVVKRGTIIAGTPGGSDFAALAAAASNDKAIYILTDDVDTAVSTTGTAYRTGHFARSKVIVGDGYTLTAADEEIMRKSGILISAALPY